MKKIDVLDKGYVILLDSMGSNSDVAESARVSYGNGTKKVNNDRGLIRHLIRNHHNTPVEQCEIRFEVKCPLFIARQWMRHRTSSFNEYSARYSIMKDEFYIPNKDRIKKQSTNNNQGSSDAMYENANEFLVDLDFITQEAYNCYKKHIAKGMTRELARAMLPQNIYTKFIYKVNLHNLFHFLKLRMDGHAQWEIQEYARAIYDLIKPLFPICCEAFEDYVLNAKTFSEGEMEVLLQSIDKEKIKLLIDSNNKLSNREKEEFNTKIGNVHF